MPRTPERPRLAVISWDVGHNPLGRAHVLAELARGRFDVEIWGSRFPAYGSEVWAPLRGEPVRIIDGAPFPRYLRIMEDAAARIDADVVWASKPRLPSFGLGALAAQTHARPLLLDVDDDELSFFDAGRGRPASVAPADAIRWRRRGDARLPYGRTWTQVCAGLVRSADAVTTSNPHLARRLGVPNPEATVVPHARDESLFDPGRHDREAARAALGVDPAARLILFGGTPRAHKGVRELVEAIDRLGDDRCRLVLFGDDVVRDLALSESEARWVLPVTPPRLRELPSILAAVDLSCVLSDPTHPVTRHQMPAKLTDALAMGVPCLATETAPLADLVAADAVHIASPTVELAETISQILDGGADVADRVERGRRYFSEHLSHAAVRPRVEALLDDALDATSPPSGALANLTSTLRRHYGVTETASQPLSEKSTTAWTRRRVGRLTRLGRREATVSPGAGDDYDLVMFWKQNDSDLYGRRQDMMLDALARSGRFRTIVHFDHPLSLESLVALGLSGLRRRPDQSGAVFARTLRRLTGRADSGFVHRHTFLHAGRRSALLGLPDPDEYPAYVAAVLADHGVGVGGRPRVFWTHPTDVDFVRIVDELAPEVVVADVIDDDRAWHRPGSPERARADRNLVDIVDRSDVMLANCDPVADRVRDLAPGVVVVPNGCDLAPVDASVPVPRRVLGLEGPIIGYVGNLSSRIDVELLSEVIRRRPDWQFVFVGSTHLGRSALRLDAHDNVLFLGMRPYAQTRRIVERFDVGLVPHVDDEMTRAMNPLKTFVYGAAGVPVVSSPVSNLPDLGGAITVAEGPDAFVAAIDRALAVGRRPVAPDVLERHSWPRRIDTVLGLIDAAMVSGTTVS